MSPRIQALGDAVEAFTRGVLVALGVVLVVLVLLVMVAWECLHDYWRSSLVLVAIAAVVVLGRCG